MSAVASPNVADGASWYALQTRPKQEERAEANLIAWGVEALLPKIRRDHRRRTQGALGARVEALFPNYLFARFDAETMAHKIRYTRGVVRIVGTAQGPTSIDGTIVTVIRRRIGADGFVRLASMLSAGDRVRITAGPLRDFVGVFESSMNGSKRVKLLLAAVEGHVRVAVDDLAVEKLSDSPVVR